jgi:hypothetical protein
MIPSRRYGRTSVLSLKFLVSLVEPWFSAPDSDAGGEHARAEGSSHRIGCWW